MSLHGVYSHASVIELDENVDYIDLSNNLLLLHDPEGKLDFKDILLNSSEFQNVNRSDLGRSFNEGVFWLKFSSLYTGEQPVNRWLVIGTAKINSVTVFLQDGQDWQAMKSGRNVPLKQKPIEARDAVFPIHLTPGLNQQIYFRIVAQGSTDMVTSLWKPDVYRSVSGERKLLVVSMMAGLLVSAVLSLIVFISLRETPYLWMGLFLIGISGLEAARENIIGIYFWPEHLSVPLQILSVFGGLAIFALSKVISHALDLHKNSILSEKIYLFARWFGLVAVVLSVFDYGLGVRMLAIIALIIHIGGLVLPLILWRRGVPLAGWFALAFGLGLLLETLRQLANLSILPWTYPMNFSLAGYMLSAPFILVGMMEQTRKLSEQLAIVSQLQQLKSEFLARVSHELRSPLNTILGFSRMLQRGSSRLSLLDGTAGIEKSALRLLDQINELLDNSKAASGKLDVHAVPALFRPWLDEICKSAKINCEMQGNQFFDIRSEFMPDAVSMDASRLRQVLENLLNNANRHTFHGKICLHCSALIESNFVVITFSVSDTGQGISSDKLDNIFEPFVRGSSLNDIQELPISGFGLGLSICKELINEMGGDISVSSKLKKGTTISFTLRLLQVNPVTIKDLQESLQNDDDVPLQDYLFNESAQISMRPRMLLLDDNPDQLKILVDSFEESGFTVLTANNRIEAISLLDQNKWDIIIMDERISEVDDWAVLKHTRYMKPNLPILLLTTTGTILSKYNSADLKFDAIILKPALSQNLSFTAWSLILRDIPIGINGQEDFSSISENDWNALVTLTIDGDLNGIEEWLDAKTVYPVVHWIKSALHRIDLGLIKRIAMIKLIQ